MAKKSETSLETEDAEVTVCGLVMPISGTLHHDQVHWSRVQQLMHRGIKQSGMKPQNVWEGSALDRVTPRIISRLFGVEICVCDISDLNPNVMLELGMRLTSKKPTVIVAETNSKIPFDIKDFEAIFYPADLNILDMEVFFEELANSLREKLAAYVADKYEPFLKDANIDFLDMAGRAVPFELLVERRLDAITERLDRISNPQNKVVVSNEISKKRIRSGALIRYDSDQFTENNVVDAIFKDSGFLAEGFGLGKAIVGFGQPASDLAIKTIETALAKNNIEAKVEAVQNIPTVS